MTSRPRLRIGRHLLPGLVAVGLFAVMAYVFVGAEFGEHAGFAVSNITATIGYAMFDVPHESIEATGTESFLVAFIIIAVVLDAALEGAVMLARREDDTTLQTALRSDESRPEPDVQEGGED